MLSARMVACIAFPLGYTCHSGAKLSVKRFAPWKGPNVCLGVCAYLEQQALQHGIRKGKAKKDWLLSLFS